MIELNQIKLALSEQEYLSVENFRVPIGESVAIIGPSGSGKTSFLKMLAGQSTPEEGLIKIDGNSEVNGGKPNSRNFFYSIPSEPHLLDFLTVKANITITKKYFPNQPAFHDVDDLLQKFGLSDRANLKPATLSQGEKQRASICRALFLGHPCILADEPLSHLSPPGRREALKTILNYTKKSNSSLIMATHNHELLNRFDKVYKIQEGTIVSCH